MLSTTRSGMCEAGVEPIDAQTRGIATHGLKDATASPGTSIKSLVVLNM